MGLVERESESAMLKGLLADCRPSAGRSVLVTGPMLTGKTALLHDFAHGVHRSGMTLLSAAGSQAERALPYGVMSLSRVMLVLAKCTSAHAAHPDLWAELMRNPDHVSIQLCALSAHGVTAMLAEQFGPEAAQRLAPAFFQASGGNPLLVRTLIDDHRSSHAEHGPAPAAGENYRQAVRSCLHRLGLPAVDAARALAICPALAAARSLSAYHAVA